MPRLLVYTRTTGYRHDSIPAGVAALRCLEGYAVDSTEDPAVFRPDQVSGYAAIVFLSTSGDVLDDAGRDALTAYMAAGGAWLGIHAASTTEYDWPWFGELVGARFDQHPPVQDATIVVQDSGPPGHPAPRRDVDPARRVVRVPRESPPERPRAADRGRGQLHRRHDGSRPPDRVVP